MYHATSGTFLYVLSCGSLSLGILSNWFSSSSPWYVLYFCFAVTSFLGLMVTNQVIAKYVKSKPNTIGEVVKEQETKKQKKVK